MLAFGRSTHFVNNCSAGELEKTFSPIGFVALSKTSVLTSRTISLGFSVVFQTRNPIGKLPFNPSNALLCTTKPPKYFANQFCLNSSKFGATTYFRVLNIATVACGISRFIRAKN